MAVHAGQHQESLLTTAAVAANRFREQQLAMSPYLVLPNIEFEEDEAEVFDKLLSPKLLQLFHPAASKVKAKSVTNLHLLFQAMEKGKEF